MRPSKIKLHEKQKRLVYIINFFLVEKSTFVTLEICEQNLFFIILRTLFSVISVFRLECVNKS